MYSGDTHPHFLIQRVRGELILVLPRVVLEYELEFVRPSSAFLGSSGDELWSCRSSEVSLDIAQTAATWIRIAESHVVIPSHVP